MADEEWVYAIHESQGDNPTPKRFGVLAYEEVWSKIGWKKVEPTVQDAHAQALDAIRVKLDDAPTEEVRAVPVPDVPATRKTTAQVSSSTGGDA